MKYKTIMKNKRLTEYDNIKDFIINNQTRSLEIKKTLKDEDKKLWEF